MSSIIFKSLNFALFNRNARFVLNNSVQLKQFSSKPINQPLVDEEGKKKRKKTDPIPKITLLYTDNDDVTVTTLEEAQKIAKRRDLKLVKIIDLDTKTQRPVYKLMTAQKFHIEDIKQKTERKSEKKTDFLKGDKILFVNCGISDHDLSIHCKKILKWIAKKFEVRIVISGTESDMSQAEKVYKQLEKNLGNDARFIQKRIKNGEIKFQIIPPKIIESDKSVSE